MSERDLIKEAESRFAKGIANRRMGSREDPIRLIFDRIRGRREERGISKEELAEYLGNEWRVTPGTAEDFVSESCETDSGLTRRFISGSRSFPGNRKMFRRRLSDYLSAIGYSNNEKEEIFISINDALFGAEEYDRDFCYQPSDVKPINGLNSIDQNDNLFGERPDPLVFFQDTAREFEVDLGKAEIKRYMPGKYNGWNTKVFNYFLDLEMFNEEYDLRLGLNYESDTKGIPSHFLRYLEDDGSKFGEFDPREHSLDYFGEYGKDISVGLSLRPSASFRSYLSFGIGEGEDSKLKRYKFVTYDEDKKRETLKHWPEFEDVKKETKESKDFRPWVTRTFELFSGRKAKTVVTVPAGVNDLEARAADDYGDPLEFARRIASELKIPIRGREVIEGDCYNRGDIFSYYWKKNKRDYSFSIVLQRETNKVATEDTFRGKRIEDSSKYPFNHGNLKLGDFNLGNDYLSLEFIVSKLDEERSSGSIDEGMACTVRYDGEKSKLQRVDFHNTYLHRDDWSRVSARRNKSLFNGSELKEFGDKKDFRPWIHRMLEFYAGVPVGEWHDPAIYSGKYSRKFAAYDPELEEMREYAHDPRKIKELEKAVDTTVDLLFTGSERNEIENRLKQARLNMRKGWASVPKLSLGAIRLPTPGQKDIRNDEFVTEAAPLFVEYMSTLGVMSAEEAERVMEQRLTNYFIHRGGFQLNRERAESLVNSLQGESPKVMRVAQ